MSRTFRTYFSLGAALAILAVLIWRTVVAPPDTALLLPATLFGFLFVFTNAFGVSLGGGRVSLLPMTTVAAYLVLGLVPAGWVAFVGALLQEIVRQRWAEQLEMRREPDLLSALGLASANAIMQTGSILAGGVVYEALGGRAPLNQAGFSDILQLLFLALTYLLVNYLIAGLYIAVRSRSALQQYLRSLRDLAFYEAAPLVFAPMMAVIYVSGGLIPFILFAVLLVAVSLITRNLATTSRRLERRVQELASLQAVGQALSSSLNLDTILIAVYTQVSKLMPARNFYIALYDPDVDEVSFPLAVENGERVPWRSRRAGHGLTEHVLRSRAPLLIQKDLAATLERIGVAMIGRPATSWLGVPIVAGADLLGIVAVQSYSPTETYDRLHQEVLATIAAQAAVAIQNARLYARTDEALARRVQELDSILRSSREGILLLGLDWQIVAANRALADFLGAAQGELIGQSLLADSPDSSQSLIAAIGYTEEALRADCQALAQEEDLGKKQARVVPGPQGRPVERTLTPVRDRDGVITGWLIVLRDLAEELALERMREEFTYILVHDLRSPLTVMRGSLDLLPMLLDQGPRDRLVKLLQLARNGNEQMLRMVNELLDISQLESERMPVHPEAVAVQPLLEDVAGRLAPLASAAEITLQVTVEPGLPPLHADPALIGRVLTNLLDNAIKFTPDRGQIQLWARPAPPSTPPAIQVGVSDTGPGIPLEMQGLLFKKFQTPSSEGRRRGTGLGLYFCKLAVEAHGGQIWVESEPGRGSNFVVQLPAVSG